MIMKKLEWTKHPTAEDTCGKLGDREIFTIRLIPSKKKQKYSLLSWNINNTFLPKTYSPRDLGTFDTIYESQLHAEKLFKEFISLFD